eukprot:TRINITY_DN36346_c0_g1_i1.p1 TRINITY_DN36346_c0_g1~~TRINITY_DN36346_c0_g1_i1.p1  ORF type:complete len:684 (+),score=108.32 TRINITY_DN36346_c0_g1_i1:66-2117(+)
MRSPSTLDDLPLLASPGPNVGSPDPQEPFIDWKRLLVNSPPAWAASPRPSSEAKKSPLRSSPVPPPFPWPAPHLPPRRKAEWSDLAPSSPPRLVRAATPPQVPKEALESTAIRQDNLDLSFDEQEQEIARFLGLCAENELPGDDSGSKAQEAAPRPLPASPRTPSPPQRAAASGGKACSGSSSWTPSTGADFRSAPNSAATSSSAAAAAAAPCNSSLDWTAASSRVLNGTPAAGGASPRLQACSSQRETPPSARDAPLGGDEEVREGALQPCSACGRRFRASRLPVHEAICIRNARSSQRRSVFESKSQRTVEPPGWWSSQEDLKASAWWERSPSKSSQQQGRRPASAGGVARRLPTSPPPRAPGSVASPARQRSRGAAPHTGQQGMSSAQASPAPLKAVSRTASAPLQRPRPASEGRCGRGSTMSHQSSGNCFSCRSQMGSPSLGASPARPKGSRASASLSTPTDRRNLGRAGSATGSSRERSSFSAPRSPLKSPATAPPATASASTVSAPRHGARDVVRGLWTELDDQEVLGGLPGSSVRCEKSWSTAPKSPPPPLRASSTAWGAVPEMPSACGSSPKAQSTAAQESEASQGSLLGSIIEDVAQLSAQVERLLSRRHHLLEGREHAGTLLRNSTEEVAELSPSDSSTPAQEGDAAVDTSEYLLGPDFTFGSSLRAASRERA